MFDTLLVANRGEIACRILRTARRLGYRCVAVHSQADADALHVQLADAAVCIGAAPAARSYLDVAALLEAARRTGAQAVHPGYGFLSERADFAQACHDAGLVFVGPSAQTIRAMGDKAQAKRRMRAAGVPCVPGWSSAQDPSCPGQVGGRGEAGGTNPLRPDAALEEAAQALGFPLLVKAVAGGGGRGMRTVHGPQELNAALASARREAEAAFGEGEVMLERLVQPARHIEVQILADAHGRVLHLGERDCSTQRRRQKLIEEAPALGLDPGRREALTRDAVAAAGAVGYVGAGTVEFIVDEAGHHFFLEMNTRLQVEHPVTECLTGIDLVEWQLRIAQGEPLPWQQAEIRLEGHAIEARVCAEDPAQGFQPQTGTVRLWAPQRVEGPGLRVDHGLVEGTRIGPWYDPLLAKVIAHGRDRADAARQLARALDELPLLGLAHNAAFLAALLRTPTFAQGEVRTHTLDSWLESGQPLPGTEAPAADAWRLAAALRAAPAAGRAAAVHSSTDSSPTAPWRPAWLQAAAIELRCGAEQRRLDAPQRGVQVVLREGSRVEALIDGVRRRAACVEDSQGLHLQLDGQRHVFDEPQPGHAAATTADPREVRSPVAGTLAQLRVAAGDRVVAGQALVSVEAMKMEIWTRAEADGTVRAVHAAPSATLAAGQLIIEIEPDTP